MDSKLTSWIEEHCDEKITYRLDSSMININFDSYHFKISIPNEKNKYFIVASSDGKRYEWIDDLNLFCIEKRPKVTRILSKIVSCLKKQTPTQSVLNNIAPTNDTFDINLHREKLRLKSCVSKSKSLFNVDTAVAKLFDQNKVADRIITEYLNAWKTFTSSRINTIDIVDDNIFHWKIQLKGFNKDLTQDLQLIQEKYHYDSIEIHIMFHDVYYPMYPPTIRVVRPRLMNSLMHRLTNSKIVHFDYWNPTNSIIDVINRIKLVIDKWAHIDTGTEFNDPIINPTGAYLGIEAKLLKLASFIDTGKTDEIDADLKLVKFVDLMKEKLKIVKNAKVQQIPHQSKTVWKDGTGYGHSGAATWDIGEYVKIQEERDKQLSKILEDIIIDLEGATVNRKQIYEAIGSSLLIPFIKEQLKSATLIDMGRFEKTYNLYFTIMQNLALDDAIYLLALTKDNDENLFTLLEKHKESATMALKLNNENKLASTILSLYSMIQPLYNTYITSAHLDKKQKTNPTSPTASTDIKDKYKQELEELKFEEANIVGDSSYHYKSQLTKGSLIATKCLKRLSDEIPTLMDSIPINYDASIFLRVDENKPMIMRALLTGPPQTPYDNGCFIFDIYLSDTYPTSPPNVNFSNTGRMRFNPNLYNCGKVCLSILGTYSGPTPNNSEKWNPATSTLYQVLISIQSQILVDDPYFNEPGYESRNDKHATNEYNNRIRLYTMKHTMLDLLTNTNTYPEFRQVIKLHFLHKRDRILEVCSKWVKESETYCNNNKSSQQKYYEDGNKTLKDIYDDYVSTYNKLTLELTKLA